MAAESMRFPETVDEFMEQYKIVDTEQVYTNGTELVPIFRMQQWFEHLSTADVRPVVRSEWEFRSTDKLASKAWTCPECGQRKVFKTNFCPNCGADMREDIGGDEDE